jgi:hypothetical protein
LTVFFQIWDLQAVKAACKTLMKLTPGEAPESLREIGSCLKSNHKSQVKLDQIPDAQGRSDYSVKNVFQHV